MKAYSFYIELSIKDIKINKSKRKITGMVEGDITNR